MRLIDADKLKEELEVSGLGYQYYMLDNAPTVEAIPYEFLRELAKNQPHCILTVWDFLPKVIENIIKAWEKENETDQCR